MSDSVCDILVIGGGMAGLAAAVHAADEHHAVTVVEKNRFAGKKILASGSGQCNITHTGTIDEFLTHYGDRGRFLKPSLYSYPNTGLLDFFTRLGIAFREEEGGKIFPASLRASDIRDALVHECTRKNVRFLYSFRAMDIAAQEIATISCARDSAGFCMTCSGKNGGRLSIDAGSIIIATGGASYPQTGSTGDGYALAESLGHTIVTPRPALAPVTVASFRLKDLSGLSFSDCRITILRNGRKISEHTGDLLITHTGLSGPVVLDHSRGMEAGDTIAVSFLGDEKTKAIVPMLERTVEARGTQRVRGIVHEAGIPMRLVDALLGLAGIGIETTIAQLEREKRKLLVSLLTSFEARIASVDGFGNAFATAGGVSTKEIDPQSMRSRIVSGLFFAGEVIDYDGDTGGYNLQAAFSTGACAGCSARNG